MKSWIGLLKKEFHLGKMNLIVSLGVITLLMIISLFAERSILEPAVKFGFALVMIGLHVFFLAGYMVNSLQVESRRIHLWLHSPQPAVKLLLAKLVNGLGSLILTLSVSLLYAIYTGKKVLEYYHIAIIDWAAFSDVVATILFYLIHMAIYFSIWMIFYWTFYRIIKGYIGNFSIAITILLFFFIQWSFAKLVETKLYDFLTGWGNLPFRFDQSTFISIFSIPPDGIVSDVQLLFLGEYLFHVLLSLGLFFLSSWLIDRKLEV